MLYKLGYNSNGDPPFFLNAEEKKVLMQQYNEVPFPSGEQSTATTSTTTNTTSAPTEPTEPHFFFLDDAAINI